LRTGTFVTSPLRNSENTRQFIALGGIERFNNPAMQRHPSSHSWLASFAARLMQLWPKVSAGTAVRCAVASIHHAATIDPRTAAEIFAQANAVAEANVNRLASQPTKSPTPSKRKTFDAQAAPPARRPREMRTSRRVALPGVR
jgi:hypothetical protein